MMFSRSMSAPMNQVLSRTSPKSAVRPASSSMAPFLLIAVFLTSHALAMIPQLATEVMMIRGGRIVFHSAASELERPLEELYFDLVETPPQEDLPWLRSALS